MRSPPPLILGAGPAGCGAAIVLAKAGAQPRLIDRDEAPGDPLCGGFLSWRTVAQLAALGVDPVGLGGHPVDRLRIFAHGGMTELALPQPAVGLSRHALDSEMRRLALLHGAQFTCDTIADLAPGKALGRHDTYTATSIFLASGKQDLRGENRPRAHADPALGLRLRLPASPERTAMLGGAIELHLFRGGYAGIVLQEGGTANICLALRKSALARAGNSRTALIAELGRSSPAFAARIGADWRQAGFNTIGAVPYGWIAQTTLPGLFRLGDQAAVIPSLAGEGIGIALASGTFAASCWLNGGAGAAPAYQRAFAKAAARPVRLAGLVRHLAESATGARAIRAIAGLAPSLIAATAAATRIDAAPAFAHSLAHSLAQSGEPA